MKTLKYLLSLIIIFTFFISCGNDDDNDTSFANEVPAPTNVSVDFSIAQDNSGLVTITPSGESSSLFTIFFGDGTDTSVQLSPGENVENVYEEGEFDVTVIAENINGVTTEIVQPLVVSFREPENLEITIGDVSGDLASRTISASADFAAMFNVFFGDVDNEEPTPLMIGETIEHRYESVGDFTVRVVALSGGEASAEASVVVTISNPIPLPVDFESDTLIYPIIGFEGADSALDANPDPSGINTSDTVLRSTKTDGAQFFAGTILELNETIDFSSSQTLQIDTYSPKADIPIRIRLENADNSVFVELDAMTTVENQWETLTYDFSALNTSADFVRVVVFFEFIVDLPGDGSTYFYDNLRVFIFEPAELPVDFESTTITYDFLGFEGADSAIEANPDPSGINTSDTVLRSTKTNGAQFFAGTLLNLDTPIDFSSTQMLQIDTYSPKANIPVRMRLENADNSVGVEVDVNTTVENQWETLIYDFSGVDPSVDFVRVVVFFEFIVNLPGDGSTYFYDNLELSTGGGGVDNVDDSMATSVEVPIGFESTTLTYDFLGFEGADSAIEANPLVEGLNLSNSVLRSTKTNGAQFFAGTLLNLDGPIDFSSTQQLSIKVLSPKTDIPIRVRLENADNSVGAELDVNTTTQDEWEELVWDFSGIDTSVDFVRIVVFFEFIVDLPGDGSTYFYDDIQLVN